MHTVAERVVLLDVVAISTRTVDKEEVVSALLRTDSALVVLVGIANSE